MATGHRSSLLRLLRVLLAVAVAGIWLGAAAIAGPYFGRVGEVSSNDSTAYLPRSADATIVHERIPEFLERDVVPAFVVVTAEVPFTKPQLMALAKLSQQLGQLPGVDGVSPPIPADDGLAAQLVVGIDAAMKIPDAAANIQTLLDEQLPAELDAYVSGPAGMLADLIGAFQGIDFLLLVVAISAVLLILIIVYRSPILPVLVLGSSMVALAVSLLVVWHLARAGVVLLSGQTQGILFILVIGAATDYSLLYVARYREALAHSDDRWAATVTAWRGSVAAIVASGTTIIAGLMCLLLSELASNRDLAPIAATGIIGAMLTTVTLLPALLFLVGPAAYWPRRPHRQGAPVAVAPAQLGMPTAGVWAWLPGWVQRAHRPIWVATAAVLVGASLGVFSLNASGVADSELVLGNSPARDGQVLLGQHFPGGQGNPLYVIVPQPEIAETARILHAHAHVVGVTAVAVNTPAGTVAVDAAGNLAPMRPPAQLRVSGADVLLQATLSDAADSTAATEVVRELRSQLSPEVLIGGVSATALDTNTASIRDRTVIIPITLVVIWLILMLLLRAVVAPLVLIATVVVSYLAALGVAAVMFNHVFKFPGAEPAVALYGFVFLVALGIDYNIFLMTRVREEVVKYGPEIGLNRGLAITGGVITSAGLVLAATFAALVVIPILFLVQLAFIVAFGVLVDTFIVRSVLVPALGHELGAHLWWPSRLSRHRG